MTTRNTLPESIKKKIEDEAEAQIKKAKSALNGITDKEVEAYYDGYRDAALFIAGKIIFAPDQYGLATPSDRVQQLEQALKTAKNELQAMYNEFGKFAYGEIVMNKINEALNQ